MIDGLGTGLELPLALFLIGCVAAMVCALPWRRWVLCAAVLGAGSARAAIAYDATAGHKGYNNSGGSSPTAVTVTVVSGETGFLTIFRTAATTVTSITGGGTWTRVGTGTFDTGARAGDLYTTGGAGGTTASSVSIAFTGDLVEAVVWQYTSTATPTVKNAGAVNATGATTGPATVSLTPGSASSFVVCGLVNTESGFTTALTGNLRVLDSSDTMAAMDNSGTGSVTMRLTQSGVNPR